MSTKTKAGTIIEHIKEAIVGFFEGKNGTPATMVSGVVNFLLEAQKAVTSGAAITIAGLVPNGIGTSILKDIQAALNEALPTAEIGKEVVADCTGITDPAALADAAMTSVLKHLNELPAEWQGKHLEEVAVLILQKLLNLPLAEIELMVKAQMTGTMPVASTEAQEAE